MTTYYVTKQQLAFVKSIKDSPYPAWYLTAIPEKYRELFYEKEKFNGLFERDFLRYVSGDETIEFKVKKQLYLLHRIDRKNREVYFSIPNTGNPQHSFYRNDAFKAPLEEIKKWKTPAWEIEEVEVQ